MLLSAYTYARSVACPVLPYPISLPAYAMPGTPKAYAATCLCHTRYRDSVCWYQPVRCPVLR
eukprot:686156-Rhodomonas_salina.2